MIDGIKLITDIVNFEAWKQHTNISFGVSVDMDTAEIRTKKRNEKIITTHRAKWETFDLIVKEVLNITTGKKIFHLNMEGSLHKNHYKGKNYLPFTFQQLQQQINHICFSLCIDPTKARISILEVGVNIVTPFAVTPFLNHNVISYKGNSFNHYKKDPAGFCLGIYCTLSQYAIKIYDKGLQNNLPYNLLRFEKRFLKMQILNRKGIKFLSDLLTYANISKLLPLLLKAWQNVLIYDIEGLQKTSKNFKLPKAEIDLLINGQNPKYWLRLKELNKRQFNYHRKKFKYLVAQYGENWQQLITGSIKTEWGNLSNDCTNLPTGESDGLYNLTIKIKGKNVQSDLTGSNEFSYPVKKRYCQTCGRDITNQKEESKFCSEKFVGYEAAHQCRNIANNLKYKIEKIHRRGVLFDITPFINQRRIVN